MLNLLIAIISDRFESVIELSISSDYKELCNLMREVEQLYMTFVKPFQTCCKKRVDKDSYLHLVRYKKEIREDDDYGVTQMWEGRVRAIKNKIKQQDINFTNSLSAVKKEIKDNIRSNK